MSELVAIGFQNKFEADEVMLSLLKLEQEHLVDLEDAVVVTKNSAGKIRIKPYYDLVVAASGMSGNFWGRLLTTLMEGSDPETLAKIGIDKLFIQKIEQTMKPDTSAIFVLVRKAEPDKIVEELGKFKGRILRTSLSKQEAAELEALLF
ncbi:hypothetical protein NIES593_19010 [Hydrococcus rivularis NIES-593]|uniref:DUF1269 domain-containing family protein n=1 Tax=Hydrococcus rivularis NIES-593 TaxID=1921803 RepID=A0A1U7H9R7_9CYAN|nr:DUF1269 domain-containing protein [Hydrococcus rivularis]OKH20320.1 hypothetical protein NIES593_19010 [Hydrococcus rivularis NIES-593]